RVAGKDESAAEAGKTQITGLRPVERRFHSTSGGAAGAPVGRSQGISRDRKRHRRVESSQAWNSSLFWALGSQSGQLSKQLSSSKRGIWIIRPSQVVRLRWSRRRRVTRPW